MKLSDIPSTIKLALVICAIVIIGVIAANSIESRRPTEGVRIILVPESFGPIVAIARRPTSITIAFESGDIWLVDIGTNYGDTYFKVVWQ